MEVKTLLNRHNRNNWFRTITVFCLSLFLVACGGGGEISRDASANAGTDTSTDTEFTLSMSIAEKVSGTDSNQLTAEIPLTVTVTVTDASGNAAVDQLVTFSFSLPDLAVFDPESGTALTDSSGVAQIDLLVGTIEGDGLVTARLETGETADIGFSSAGGGTDVDDPPATLDLFASATQLASSGSESVELIALVKNAQNILLSGIAVSFASTSGELQITQGTTEADGTARALLTSQNNKENRTFTVSATVGGLTQELEITVVGTEVKINGPASVILNDTQPITISVVDSDGRPIEFQEVQLSSSSGNTLSDTSPVTDDQGAVTIDYTANNSGEDTITATALNATGTAVITVQQDQFSFSSVPTTEIELNTDASFTVTWLRENTPLVGGDVTLSTTRGVIADTSLTTDANGQVSTTIQSSNAGSATILAQGLDSEGEQVNARAEVEFIATELDNIIMSASPNSIGPDGQKSTITAILRDARGNLVKGKTVNFVADDVSNGEINPPSAVTDSNGLASTVYTSNTVTTENGITITATEPESGIAASTSLTVADRALFISIGTGNIIETPTDSSYLKQFSVFVTDANSNPVANVDLTVSGTPVKYSELLDPNAVEGDPNFGVQRSAFYKGFWEAFPSADAFEFWVANFTVGCANEDVDDDAICDNCTPAGSGEDTNGNAELTPGNIGSIDGNVTTDDNGQAIIELRYPKTFAPWVELKITVSTPVSGSESSVSQFYLLGAAASDLTIESTPPNVPPFGSGTSCTNVL